MAKTNVSNMIIDFDDIEESGTARVRVPEGDYPAVVKSVSFSTSQAGNPMLIFIIAGTGGKFKGKELKEYCALTKKALWKLRDLLTATGVDLPKKQDVRSLLSFVKKNVIGKELGVTLGDDEFVNDKGKSIISSKVQDYMDIDSVGGSAVEESEDDDDADIEEEDDDDDDEDEDDGLDELDRAGLKAHIKAEELDIKVLKKMTDEDIRTAIRAAAGDEEVEDLDLDEL